MCKLLDIAISAYRNQRYTEAIFLLVEVSADDPNNWLARLYLGMAYEKMGLLVGTDHLFNSLIEECPDPDIRQQAQASLAFVDAEVRRRFPAAAPANAQTKPLELAS